MNDGGREEQRDASSNAIGRVSMHWVWLTHFENAVEPLLHSFRKYNMQISVLAIRSMSTCITTVYNLKVLDSHTTVSLQRMQEVWTLIGDGMCTSAVGLELPLAQLSKVKRFNLVMQ